MLIRKTYVIGGTSKISEVRGIGREGKVVGVV